MRIFLCPAGGYNLMQIPGITLQVLPGDLIHNYPVISLVFANTVTIVLAVLGNWDAAMVMFVYLIQSIIIGIFSVVSILGADTAALRADLQRPIDEQGGTETVTNRFAWFYQCILAGFFALHYGLFHLGYFFVIVDSDLFGTVNLSDPGIWLACGLFFANHLYSHITYRHAGPKDYRFVNENFFSPYGRIIPMHLTILFGSIIIVALQILGLTTTLPVLVLFLILKTYSDINAHLIKHEREENPDAPVRFF